MAAVTEAVKAVFVNISDGVKNSNMPDESKEVWSATIGQLFVMVDMIAGLMNNFGVLVNDKAKLEGDLRGVMASAGVVQGAVDTLIKQQESKRENAGGHRRNNVLESKAVSNLKTLGSERSTFRMWHEKLVNIMEQLSPGSRGLFKALTRYVDHEIEEDFADWTKNQTEFSGLKDAEVYDRVNEDVYVLLMDKAESDALTRVRGCPPGRRSNGISRHLQVVYGCLRPGDHRANAEANGAVYAKG